MKIRGGRDIPGSMDALLKAADAPPRLDVEAVYAEHAGFVWRTLQRLGAIEADLPDLFQEVFLVLHRRRDELVDDGQVRGLLFGIAVGLVRNHRRRSTRWRDRLTSWLGWGSQSPDPQEALDASRRRSRGMLAFSRLDPEKRAVFVMFELEGLSGQQIAATLGIPLGTVHSRLYAARRQLQQEILGVEEA